MGWLCKGCQTRNSTSDKVCKKCRYPPDQKWDSYIDCPHCNYDGMQATNFGGSCVDCGQKIKHWERRVYKVPAPE